MTTQYTDQQLQHALAKMLPDSLQIFPGGVYWRGANGGDKVFNTEWLHICWLVERTLSNYSGDEGQEYSQQDDYACELLKQVATYKENFRWGSECVADFYKIANASWQQRAIALAKVKNITI